MQQPLLNASSRRAAPNLDIPSQRDALHSSNHAIPYTDMTVGTHFPLYFAQLQRPAAV